MSSEDQILNHLIELKQGQARVEAKLDTTIKAYDEKFEDLELDVKDINFWQNVTLYAVLPVVAALHYLANKMGFLR